MSRRKLPEPSVTRDMLCSYPGCSRRDLPCGRDRCEDHRRHGLEEVWELDDEQLWSRRLHPSLHWDCRCVLTPIAKRDR